MANAKRMSQENIETNQTTDVIVRAIPEQCLIKFDYHAHERTVEPFVYGIGAEKNPLLRAFQTRGSSESGNINEWKLFNVAEMRNVTLLPERFDGKRSDYNPKDSAMQKIISSVPKKSEEAARYEKLRRAVIEAEEVKRQARQQSLAAAFYRSQTSLGAAFNRKKTLP